MLFCKVITKKIIFFLLLLSGAYIPIDIQRIITGSEFASNIYGYVPVHRLGVYSAIIEGFELEESSSIMNSIGINYISTIVNTFFILFFLILAILLHLCIFVLRLILSKCNCRNSWLCRWINKLIDKVFNLITFDYYIRNAIEISQFILISSINELYVNNTTETHRLTSFIYAVLMITLFVLFLFLIQYLIFSFYKLNKN